MRILAVAPSYEPEGGGLERYAHAVLRRLAARGHAVRAVAFTRGEPREDEADGVAVERLAATFRIGNAPVRAGLGRLLRARIEAFRPDVVAAHSPVPFAAEMACWAARRERVPFVLTYHAGRLRGSTPLREALAGLHRAGPERRMIEGSQGLIAVGPFVRDHALARERGRVTVVPPGVDTQLFFPRGEPEPGSILFVGPLDRAYRWKGVDVLWDAFRQVRRQVPRARLTLVGAGDRLVEFRRRAAGDEAIRVPGRLPVDRLAEAYRRAAVTVLPSTSDAEAFGMVLAEANACGRPAVGSRVGGIPDFVRPGENGLLARPGDAGDLAARILRILTDDALAGEMGRRGRELVLRRHDWNRLAEATEGVLASAAGFPAAQPASGPRRDAQRFQDA